MSDTETPIARHERTIFFPQRPTWQADANCRGVDPDLFFPDGPGLDAQVAREICSDCPVRGDCLDYAIDHGERFGIWGGLNDPERRAVRRRSLTTASDDRRRQVIAMAADGIARTDIARELGISRRTVHRYIEDAS